ncbi:MAG: tyrosine--tRNA ligase [Victivallales bacterium]|nr:tyrosine--tRNA ligase [Victivallales bacterium]
MTNALDILKERGFLYQMTDEQTMRDRLEKGPATFYVGFDPTGSSLHIGHLLPIMGMRWLQKCGHRPIALVGGGTAMIGDPSGKTTARPIMTVETIDENVACLKKQLSRFLDFSNDKALLLNNAEWLRNLNLLEFLRDIGSLFSVPRMLAHESVKMRLETGLSFLEFSYPLMQSYDFYILNKEYGCEFQFGGQDQWGNMTAGTELTRKLSNKIVHVATFPLLLKSDGTKFGKTAGGAVWLDPERTSPFNYYQFWRNTEDSEVKKLLALFTALPMDEVNRLGDLPAPDINRAKEILAYEATALAHGHDEAIKAYAAAGNEFGFADKENKIPTSSRIAEASAIQLEADIPTFDITLAELDEGLPIFILLAKSGLCKTSSDARRLVKGGGCSIDDRKITDEKYPISANDFVDGAFTLKAGKKARKRIRLAK